MEVLPSATNFTSIYDENVLHVDKTLYLYNLIQQNSVSKSKFDFKLLCHYPRRFGKTSTLSLIENYFQSCWPGMTVDDAKIIVDSTRSNDFKKSLPLWLDALYEHVLPQDSESSLPEKMDSVMELELKMKQAAEELISRYKVFSNTLFFKNHRAVFDTHFAKYPVISVSFLNTFHIEFEVMRKNIIFYLINTVKNYLHFGFCHTSFGENVRNLIQFTMENMNHIDPSNILFKFSHILFQAFRKPCILLVDDYDHPLQQALLVEMKSDNVSKSEIVQNTRSLFTSILSKAIKGNDRFVCGSVVMGMTPLLLNNENSGFNVMMYDCMFLTQFPGLIGFTEEESMALLQAVQPSLFHNESRSYFTSEYEGYVAWRPISNKTRLYCPWSVMNVCKTSLLETTYWNLIPVDNASVEVQLAKVVDKMFIQRLILWLQGHSVQVRIERDISWDRLKKGDVDALTYYFLYCGYLTRVFNDENDPHSFMSLCIPNLETKEQWLKLIPLWMESTTNGNVQCTEHNFDSLIAELVQNGNHLPLCEFISRFLQHGIEKNENRYYLLALGIVSFLTKCNYKALSHREGVTGRLDIYAEFHNISDLNFFDIIIELKHSKESQNLDNDVQLDLAQIKERNYAQVFNNINRKKLLLFISVHKKNCKYFAYKME